MIRSFHYAVGEVIPGTPYRVTQHIAAGGMGAVFEVDDVGIGRQYALKTLHASMAGDEKTEERMREEARTLGRLTNPNIVQVFTAGVTKDHLKLPFIVMERLVGSTLRGLLQQRGALDLRTTAVIALELLGALEDAHEFGLVHRDIKPDNVFLHRLRRGQRTTKLLDFGVADLVSKANQDPSLFFGTFRYASPEQLLSVPIAQTSDIYAVGLLVYEMLAGHHPFVAAKTRENVVRAHVLEVPSIPKDWPESIRKIVASALEKSPANRPKDAWTFASKLRRAVRDLSIDIDTPLVEEIVFQNPTVDVREPIRVSPIVPKRKDPMNESQFARLVVPMGNDTERDVTINPISIEMLTSGSAVIPVIEDSVFATQMPSGRKQP